MRRFEAHETWGMVAVRDLSPLAVQTARDAMKETPVMANQMLSVGRTIWDWAIPLGLAVANPFDKVKDFDIPDRGHVPWPAWVVDYVLAHAWPDLVRMERLGIMRCQHGSDLIRMGRWLADTQEGRVICRRWKDWDIDPGDADHPTIHGLRGTGILARVEQGYEVDQIANDIGMSRRNVKHYMWFSNQMKGWRRWPRATSSRQRRGLDRERRLGYMGAANRRICKTPGSDCKTSEKSSVKSVPSVGNGVTVAQRLSG